MGKLMYKHYLQPVSCYPWSGWRCNENIHVGRDRAEVPVGRIRVALEYAWDFFRIGFEKICYQIIGVFAETSNLFSLL